MKTHKANRVILFAGGGTAGHVVPALAVAEVIRKTGAARACFCGSTSGFEQELVASAGFPFVSIPTAPYLRRFDRSLAKSALLNSFGLAKACMLIHRLRPAVVVGMGGYVSVPVGIAAVLNRCPLILHEQNSIPGLGNRLLSPLAELVCVSFPSTVQCFPQAVWTGNPVRFAHEQATSTGKRKKSKTLLCFGGSQGAGYINTLLLDSLTHLMTAGITLKWAAGRTDFSRVNKVLNGLFAANPSWKKRIDLNEYITDMETAMMAADLVVARAGATTIAELTVLGKPALLIPFPHATDNHQVVNARQLERSGGCRVIEQRELGFPGASAVELFVTQLQDLLDNRDELDEMERCSGNFGKKGAAYSVFRIIMQHISKISGSAPISGAMEDPWGKTG